jgi:hypothetical protein
VSRIDCAGRLSTRELPPSRSTGEHHWGGGETPHHITCPNWLTDAKCAVNAYYASDRERTRSSLESGLGSAWARLLVRYRRDTRLLTTSASCGAGISGQEQASSVSPAWTSALCSKRLVNVVMRRCRQAEAQHRVAKRG